MAEKTDPAVTAAAAEETPAEPTLQTPATGQGDPAPIAPVEQQEKTYVTREELEERDAELLRRIKQSSRSRAEAIEKRFGEIKDLMVSREAPLSPVQESALRAKIEEQIDGPAPEEQNAPNDTIAQQLNEYVGAVFTEVGTAVTPNDPEFKELRDKIDEAWTIQGPRGLVVVQMAAQKAATDKAKRVALQKKNAPARVVSGGEQRPSNPNNIATITDTEELYAIGDKQIRDGKNKN